MSLSKSAEQKMITRIATRHLWGYEASTEWEKMIGSELIEQTGVDDAEKSFFEKAMKNIADEMEKDVEELKDMDPGDMTEEGYDDFVRGVMEAADEEGLIDS